MKSYNILFQKSKIQEKPNLSVMFLKVCKKIYQYLFDIDYAIKVKTKNMYLKSSIECVCIFLIIN